MNMWKCCWNWFPNLHNWYTRSNPNNQAKTFSCCIAKHLQNRLLKTWFKALSSFTIKKNNLYNYNRSSSLETLHILIYPPPIAKFRLNKLKYLPLSLFQHSPSLSPSFWDLFILLCHQPSSSIFFIFIISFNSYLFIEVMKFSLLIGMPTIIWIWLTE